MSSARVRSWPLGWVALGMLWGCTSADSSDQPRVYMDTIEALEPMTEARFGHTATALADGRALIVGGLLGSPSALDADAYVAEVDLWDPVTRRFERGASLASPRSQHSATALADGRVVVLGGNAINEQGLTGAALAVELWDPATQGFSTVAELDTRLLFHCAVPVAAGVVLAIDDCYPEGCVARQIDVDAGTVIALGGTPTHRYGLDVDCALLPDGRVLLASGADMSPAGDVPTDELEIYDPVAETFERVGPMSNAFGEPSELVTLAGGEFLLMGGAEELPVGQLFTAADQQFMAVGGDIMDIVDRREHQLVALDDGRALIIGGQLMDSPSFEYVSALDAYDPTTNSFVPVGASIPGRRGHASARLSDGSVLIVGGRDDSGELADAYLFE